MTKRKNNPLHPKGKQKKGKFLTSGSVNSFIGTFKDETSN